METRADHDGPTGPTGPTGSCPVRFDTVADAALIAADCRARDWVVTVDGSSGASILVTWEDGPPVPALDDVLAGLFGDRLVRMPSHHRAAPWAYRTTHGPVDVYVHRTLSPELRARRHAVETYRSVPVTADRAAVEDPDDLDTRERLFADLAAARLRQTGALTADDTVELRTVVELALDRTPGRVRPGRGNGALR